MRDTAVEVIESAALTDAGSFVQELNSRLGKTLAHERTKSAAADIGTAVHTAIERELRAELGLQERNVKAVQLSDGDKVVARRAFDSYKEWRRRSMFRPTHVETKVWCLEHKYAGTMDVAGVGNFENDYMYGQHAVGDWKTSASIYLSAALQVSAYRHALLEIGLATPGELHGLVLRLPKTAEDPDFEARFIPEKLMKYYFEIFLHVQAIWQADQDYSKQFPRRRKKKAA